MAYVTYSTQVKQAIEAAGSYPMVTFEMRVDNTAYTTVKYHNGEYFERDFAANEVLASAADMAAFVARCVESYFTGWAARKGLAVR